MSSIEPKATITIEIQADIQRNGVSNKALVSHLQAATSHAVGSGLLTGDTPAEVDVHSAEVTLNRGELEDEITRFLQGQIEDGQLDPESMAARIARYGLMLPSGFIAEMNERAEQVEAA